MDVTKLYTHNVDVDRINKIRLAKVNEKENVYYQKSACLSDLAEILYRHCLTEEKLVLKKEP